MAKIVVLSEYNDIVAASMDQEKLRSSGIKCHVTDDLTQIALPNTISGARLFVDECDVEAAAAVLRAHKDAAPVFEDDETEKEEKKPKIKHLIIVQSVLFIFIYLIFESSISSIWSSFQLFFDSNYFENYYSIAFTSLIAASLILMFTLIYRKHSFAAYYSFSKFRAGVLIPIVVTIIGYYLLIIFINAENQLAIFVSNLMIFKHSILTNQPDFLLFVLFFVVATPICEELIFRGFILNKLLSKYGPVFSIVFSALLYAVIYVNMTSMIATFALGLLLAYLFYRTKSVLPCIIAHLIFNLMIALQYPIIKLFLIYESSPNVPIGASFSLIGIVGGILLILGMLFLYAGKSLKKPG